MIDKVWVRGSASWYELLILDGKPVCPCPGYVHRRKCRHVDDYNAGKYARLVQFRLTIGDEIIEGKEWLNGTDAVIMEAAEKMLWVERKLSILLGLPSKIEQVQ